MELLPRLETVKNPPSQFTGDVWLDVLAAPRDPGQQAFVGRVRFAPGARTAWHRHALGQTLHVTQGVAWMGSRDGSLIVARAGDTVYCPPGEDHWHGAAPDSFMEHLAIVDNPDSADHPGSTTWLEHVTDAEYGA
jgi:quercetin dioxygenase-like cupin family protein